MKLSQHNSSTQDRVRITDRHCNHPLAVVVDPTDRQLSELEAMLAQCPNCSRWTPGDGPIMATLPGQRNGGHPDAK
jgi:hypothetical protein